jgi:hypothetical protein
MAERLADGGASPAPIIPSLDELEDGHASGGVAAKRNRGGRKGAVKPGGRRKPLTHKPGRVGRFGVAERSGVLEFRARMCAGKPIAMRGPTGKSGFGTIPHSKIENGLPASRCATSAASC